MTESDYVRPPGGDDMLRRVNGFLRHSCGVMEHSSELEMMFAPIVAVWRDGRDEPVAVVVSPGREDVTPVDLLVSCLGAIARGFDADLMALAVDTYTTESPINPLTGEPWNHGEMEVAFQLGNTGGVISECLSIHASRPDGLALLANARYRRNPDRTIHWLDEGRREERVDNAEAISGWLIGQIMAAWETAAIPIPAWWRERADEVAAEQFEKMGLLVGLQGKGFQ